MDLGVLRQRITPERLIGTLAFAAGLLDKPETVSPRELASVFDWSRVQRDSICLNTRILI